MATLTHRQPLPGVRASLLRLPILDGYLLREMLGPFLFAFGAFLLFWALNIFFLAADYIINQHAPFFLVLRFVVFRIPQAIPMAFPFACLFAALLAMGRVMGDNEVTAMRTAGISVMRIAVAPLAFGMMMFLIAYAMNEWIAPPSVELSTRTFYQIIYHTESLPVEPQFFRKDEDTGNVFYVTQVGPDNRTMEGVQIFKPARYGPWNETLQAKTATVRGSTLLLHDVIDTRYNNDGFVSNQQHVKEISIGLPMGETVSQFVSNVNNDPWTMSSKSLRAQVNALQTQGIGGTALGNLQINLADKLAWPFACFIGVLLALPLALRFGKRGRTLGIAMAIISFFIYYLMTSAASAFGRNGAVDPYVAAWLPNAIMGSAGAVLLWLEER
ncbi:MAG TPA: LptF/LptG family permease [Candidatus Baltobacteraceae bacterium]|nr:LptF/LptG family permease [Candidatus Baltobacteraceae bacterium]